MRGAVLIVCALLVQHALALVPMARLQQSRRVAAQTQLGVWGGGETTRLGDSGPSSRKVISEEGMRRELREAWQGVKVEAMRFAAGVLLASTLLLSTPGISHAAPRSRSGSSTGGTATVSRPARTSKKTAPQPAAAPAVDVDAVSRESDATKSRRLTETGLALVVINIIAILVSGDADVSPKSKATKKKKRQMPVLEEDDEEDDLFASPSPKATPQPPSPSPPVSKQPVVGALSAKLKRSQAVPSPPPKEELFGNNDVDEDDLFADSDPLPVAPQRTQQPAKAASPPPTPPSPVPPAPTPVPTPPPPPPPPAPAKKNILDRIFSKPGGGRPTEIAAALHDAADPSHSFRKEVAHALASYVPEGLFVQLRGEALDAMRAGGREAQAEALREARDASGLTEQEAAVAFADVTNAMLVTMVDRAAAQAQQKGAEQGAIAALNDVADFIGGAGDIYGQTVPGAVIEPVVYNGKARKGDLETCYFLFLKESMTSAAGLAMGGMSGAGAGEGQEGEGSEGGEAAATAAAQATEAAAADYTAKLGRLQVVFSIKEGKRSSLEQKAVREMIMSMTQGGGGEGMAGMFDALTGKGGGGGMGGMDMGAMGEMLGAMGGEAELQRELEAMDPAEMAAASQEAVVQVRSTASFF